MNVSDYRQRDDLAIALADADALDQFQALPLEEQERFSAWIAKSRDEDTYWRRIDILVMGMRMAPRIQAPLEQRAMPDFWTDPKP